MFPEDQKAEHVSLFDEFEVNETPEAKFAHSMDNFQPLLLNNSNGGADWREHGVAYEQVYKRHSKIKLGSEKLYGITNGILEENIEKRNIKKSK